MNGDPYEAVAAPDNNVFALASDSSGNVYMGGSDNSVKINVVVPGVGAYVQPFLQLPFQIGGIAIDSVRGRVYISNYTNSTIAVYGTAGVLLHTIQ